mmetsp:Transcript_13833/g.23603  ORF Transcript_13833/g.23603 Transcript_13833/m.23603 type:complete len:209 (-) Transcript_13833:154-780(-)
MVRGESSVGTEYLFLNDGCDRQAIKCITERFPELDVVPSPHLVIESVDPVDACALVVSSEDEKVLWVPYFEREKQANGFDGLLPPIYVISEEEVIGLWWKLSVLKQAEEVVILSVDISTYFYGCVELEQGGLCEEDLLGFKAERTKLGFLKDDWLGTSAVSDFEQPFYHFVEVEILIIGYFAIHFRVFAMLLVMEIALSLSLLLPHKP